MSVEEIIYKVFVPELEKRLSSLYGEKVNMKSVPRRIRSEFEWELPCNVGGKNGKNLITSEAVRHTLTSLGIENFFAIHVYRTEHSIMLNHTYLSLSYRFPRARTEEIETSFQLKNNGELFL